MCKNIAIKQQYKFSEKNKYKTKFFTTFFLHVLYG